MDGYLLKLDYLPTTFKKGPCERKQSWFANLIILCVVWVIKVGERSLGRTEGSLYGRRLRRWHSASGKCTPKPKPGFIVPKSCCRHKPPCQYTRRHICALITKTIKIRRTRLAGRCWRNKDELINDMLLGVPSHRRTKAGRAART